jgi:hypothetical protein
MFTSFIFLNMSLSTGHHSPLIWHHGDKIPDKLDWGIFQIIAVLRVPVVDNNLLLASTTFGNHILHHLLPTVDHSKLPLVHNTFLQTCHEFGIKFEDNWFDERKIAPSMGFVAMIQEVRASISISIFIFGSLPPCFFY